MYSRRLSVEGISRYFASQSRWVREDVRIEELPTDAETEEARSAAGSVKTNLVLPHSLPTAKIKRALALLEEIFRSHPMTQQALISLNQFAGANLNVMIVHWWKGTDYEKYLAGMQEMNLAVKERFDAEGIGFA